MTAVLFYVQHLLGIGHLRRALYLAEALTRDGARVTLVAGGEPLPELARAAAERVIQLAPVRARDAGFRELVDADGRTIDDSLRAARREALLAAFAGARPDAVVIEAFPFGRRAFRFELDPLIEAARARRPPAVVLCSLRDIVVAPEVARRRREIVDRVRADFDAVLVHGDPTLIPLESSFAEAAEVADRLVYTGYVGAPDEPTGAEDGAGHGEVLVSAGGGAVGGALLATALEARRLGCLSDRGWRLLAGPNLPQTEFAALAAGLPQGVILERYRHDFPQMLRRCRVSVSQAGYNTVLDILAAGAAAVLVPFAGMRETEQGLRADRLAARGVVETVAPAELSPERLARAIERAALRRPVALAIDTGGARRTARLIADMIGRSAGTGAMKNFVMSPGDYTISE
jgi:predicted glycosyltransferase